MKHEATVALLVLVLAGWFTPMPVCLASSAEAAKSDDEQEVILRQREEAEQAEKGAFFRLSGLGMFGASASDMATTEWGLTQPGIYESNPMAANRGVRVVTHVVAPALVWWTTEKLHKSGRGKLALAFRIGLMAAYSYAAMHNLRTIQER